MAVPCKLPQKEQTNQGWKRTTVIQVHSKPNIIRILEAVDGVEAGEEEDIIMEDIN